MPADWIVVECAGRLLIPSPLACETPDTASNFRLPTDAQTQDCARVSGYLSQNGESMKSGVHQDSDQILILGHFRAYAGRSSAIGQRSCGLGAIHPSPPC